MEIIDSHVHLGHGLNMALMPDALLAMMDKACVRAAVVCPMDKFLAVHNREGNEYVAGVVRDFPDRFTGMASVNPWFGKDAERELVRALESGLTGLKLHSVLQGFRLSDHIVDPLLRIAMDFKVPVYMHTGTAGCAEPFHAVELARRFPELNFIMGHAGASDYYNDTVRALEFCDNLWIETSRNGPANFCLWKTFNVIDRIVFGSNAPEYIPELEIANLKDVFTDPDERERVFSKNIRDVYRGKLPL